MIHEFMMNDSDDADDDEEESHHTSHLNAAQALHLCMQVPIQPL